MSLANPSHFLFTVSSRRGLPAPVFEQVVEQGPPHMRTYVWQCQFHGYTAQGQGRTKKEAKAAAARAIQVRIDVDSLPDNSTYQANMERKRKREEAKKQKEGEDQRDDDSGASGDQKKPHTKQQRYNYKRHEANEQWKRQFFMRGRPRFGPPGPGFGPRPPWLGPRGGPFFPEPPFFHGMPGPPGPDFFPCGPEYFPERMRSQPGCSPPRSGPFAPRPNPLPLMEVGGPFSPAPPMRELNFSREDRHILTKHQEILPVDNELRTLLKLVQMAEECLAKACRELNQDDEKLPASQNRLEGVSRVGELAKGLLLNSDRAVNLVLVCKKPPTLGLLKKVANETEKEVKASASSAKEVGYTIHLFEDEAGFCVVSMPVTAADNTDPELPYAVNITLTCPQLRETVSKDRKEEEKETEKKDQADEKDSGESDSGVKDAGEKGAGEKDASEKDAGEKDAGEKDAGEKDAGEKDAGEKDADEKDADEKDADEKDAGEKDADQKDAGENDAAEDERALPLDKCLQALAEMRRAKWFVATAANVASCVECIRIMKELCSRDVVWSCLNDWAVELLCESSLTSNGVPLPSPSLALKRVLETVAGGIFLPDGPGLQDPCEREPVDAASSLTQQQQEDLTASAQTFLRLMIFGQIHKVLGMEKLEEKQTFVSPPPAPEKAKSASEEEKQGEEATPSDS